MNVIDLFNNIFTYPILNGLMLLYHLFGDFGLSIIVLTLIIKLILFPLTLQQLKSMKANQALQPQIAEIRKKYAKDQQGQMLATQALYKEYNINPLAGCLPLFIQLPVLYGLFYALNGILRNPHLKLSDINTHLYPFVPHFSQLPNLYLNWFTFLNSSWHFPLGSPYPPLAILAGLATFVQLRMSQPKTTSVPGAAPDPSAQSMKMMQYMMPLVTVFFGWTFPAGLALYWTISSTFQAAQQYFVTGWGSLLVAPNFAGNEKKSAPAISSKSYSGDQRRERELQQQANEADVEGEESSGLVEGRTIKRSGSSSSARRRHRVGSASARRRGSAQRSRS